jgi:hypothetical protein
MGEAGEPCGRPQRNGLGSSSYSKNVNTSVQLVVKEQVHSQR